ncbi:MAG: hypothetical protein ACR2PG_16370 [Hyphomicrobiaceae bacterium]
MATTGRKIKLYRMQWLVDLDRAVKDGTLTADGARELKQRARETMVSYAINLALFAGIVMVIGGTVTWLEDNIARSAIGVALTTAGAITLLRGGARLQIVANATAIIGATLAIVSLAGLLFEGRTERLVIGAALGLPTAALGWMIFRFGPKSLSLLGGWILLLGAGTHVAGVLTTESKLGLEWLALHYAGAIAIACGLILDVRFVTAIAMVPLAASLSSRTFYSHAAYGVAIYEVTLTILQMGLFAVLAFAASLQFSERIARHARTLGQLALIWTNMAFWIGSLWGDVVGLFLWGPRWNVVTSDTEKIMSKYEAWKAAVDAFKAQTLTIPADVFAAAWAVGIISVGAWGALTARRAVLNIAVTFGAIHFYTQYFERLQATPGVIIIAGVIAILASWALWTFNGHLARR